MLGQACLNLVPESRMTSEPARLGASGLLVGLILSESGPVPQAGAGLVGFHRCAVAFDLTTNS
jgi:hypothetical protein